MKHLYQKVIKLFFLSLFFSLLSGVITAQLVVNEFMASNDSWTIPGEDASEPFPDWIELYNTGNEAVDIGGWYATDDFEDSLQYQFPTNDPELTTVAPYGYMIIYCDGLGEGLHTNFKLSGSGEGIGFLNPDGAYIKYTYCDTGCDLPNPGTDNSTGRITDGDESWLVFNFGSDNPPTPGSANGGQANVNLIINEFLASNDASLPGPQGDYPDWIEIYNAGSESIMLGGYYMSDKLDEPDAMYQIKSTYPDSVTIEAGGHIVFYANKLEDVSVLCLNFKLSGDGEHIGLWDPDQNFIDSLTYGPQYTDTSYGRIEDGSSEWVFFSTTTPGESNDNGVIASVISPSISGPVPLVAYPNPASYGQVYFNKQVTISVYSINGQLLMTKQNVFELNIEGFNSGMYFIKTENGEMVKLIVN